MSIIEEHHIRCNDIGISGISAHGSRFGVEIKALNKNGKVLARRTVSYDGFQL